MAVNRTSPSSGKIIDVPASAPTGVTATDLVNGGGVSVAFTAPSTATGGPIFSYTATSNPGSITQTGTSSPLEFSGLTVGTSYTFTVAAVNPTGSQISSPSSAVTPTAPPTSFDSISTATLTSTASSITISNIPSTYKHLQLRFKLYVGTNQTNAILRFNGDTGSSYPHHEMYGVYNGTSTGLGTSWNLGGSGLWYIAGTSQGMFTGYKTVGIIDIFNYADTTMYKSAFVRTGIQTEAAQGRKAESGLYPGVWQNTSAVTSITIVGTGTNFVSNTTMALYGIRG